ncbi:unnamed protein product [Mycena citricolor]|uniref:BHLH domain-containing protein n=1 Tax=Mycena citricolor TaxID=2018698 RepID=A0AAD2HD85_9AGAR|nr:unnamed protein product [Mycena citricolor]
MSCVFDLRLPTDIYGPMHHSPPSFQTCKTSLSAEGRTISGSSEHPASGPVRSALPNAKNTVQRRAAHNAVERSRRKSLNAQFQDLAELLPNLRQLRRPTKSAIVDSSIAHVRAYRRYRTNAAHQVRMLSAERDELRRELEGWRSRAGVNCVESPDREAEWVERFDEGFGSQVLVHRDDRDDKMTGYIHS